MRTGKRYAGCLTMLLGLSCICAMAQVTYKPYIQSGDMGGFGATDQKVIAWQTAENAPNPAYHVEFGETPALGSSAVPQGRVVDNYLAADTSLPVPSTASGPHVNYHAVLKGLEFDTTYFYRVTGPWPARRIHIALPHAQAFRAVLLSGAGRRGIFPGGSQVEPAPAG